jgi:signal transduction histidine kinase
LDERGRRINRSRWPHNRAARGEAFEMAFTLQPPNAERRWFEAHGAPIGRGLGFRGGVVVIRDITDRSLRTQQEAFVATASHELRTPIAALHGYVQLLERRLDPEKNPREAEYARVALGQARRVGVLLERLFDLARIQSGHLEVEREPVDLRDSVERACDVARQLAARHQVSATFPEGPIVVEADGARLEQVLLNLLTNAVQHAPESELIDVTVTVADGRARVQIQDYGPGIPQERLTQILRRRTSRRTAATGYQGLGLGLAISRELIRAQRGSIEISSDPGRGTTATLELPLWRSDPRPRRRRK